MPLATLKSCLLAFMVACTVFAVEADSSNMVAFNNLNCPVSGTPAKTAYMGAYNGVIYRFCCAEHITEFQKNPQLYLTNLPNSGVIVDLANEICPVSGQPAQKTLFIVIDGCKVHAKCAATSAMLRRFPAQYLEKAQRIKSMTPEQLKKEFLPKVAYNNSVCPVTGKPVVKQIAAIYSNIVYKFSSIEARAAFTNAPRKYLSKLPNNGQITDMGNEFCPDAGDKVDKKMSVVVEGQRIYVGCKGCAMNVLKDPQGYITRVKKLMAMTPDERKADFAKRGPCKNSTCPSKAGAAEKPAAASACATCPNAGKEACEKAAQAAPAEESVQVVEFNNAICPVTGKPSDTRFVVVRDKIVYKFSSDEARAAFESAPDTYLSKLPGNGKITDMGNEFCPDAGDKVDKKLSVVVEGTRIYVGCKGCAMNVLKDPQGYITRVKKLMAMTPEERKADFAKREPCKSSTCPAKAAEAATQAAAEPSACATCPNAGKEACDGAKKEPVAPAPAKADCATCPNAGKAACDGANQTSGK